MNNKYVGFVFASASLLILCSCAPVTIDSVPPGAAVYSADGETQVGSTPFDTSVVHWDKNFTVRQSGYFDETVTLDYNAPRHVHLALRPVPVMVQSTPVAEIYPAGSDASVGSTPMKLFISEEDKTYTLKADGYYDRDITIGLNTEDPVIVELARRPIVTLSATPAGVEVFEKGKKIGTAPIVEEITAGRTFELRKKDHFTRTLTLAGAPPYEVSVDLKPFPVITVSSTPANADVYQGGKWIGKSPVSIPVGEKTDLEVRADRFYPQGVSLMVDSPAQVPVALKAMPFVAVNSDPAGAQVFVSGKAVGTAPVELLVEKDTVVEFRKGGFITKSSTLTPADRQVTVKLQVEPPPPMKEEPTAEPVEVKEVQPEAVAVAAPALPEPEETAPARGNSRVLWGAALVALLVVLLLLFKRKK